MTGVGITEEVSYVHLGRSEWFKLLWGFLWRGVCISAGSALTGIVAGFLIGALCGVAASATGVPVADYSLHMRILGGLVGAAIGVWFLTFFIRWLLRARFGSLRLALIRVVD